MTRRGLLATAALPVLEPGVDPPLGARLPMGLPVRDTHGRALTMGEALGGLPAVFAFADYRCRALCGTALGLAAARLPETGLRPGEDYRLVVLGLDPASAPDEAAAMQRAWLGEDTPLAGTARFLVAEAQTIAAAEQAMGYSTRRTEVGFDHPAVLFALRADGRVAAVLPALGATPEALLAALRADAPSSLAAAVAPLCEALGAGVPYRLALAGAGAATVGGLAAALLALRRREHRA